MSTLKMAHDVIATAIDEWMRGLPQHGERLAAAIIARLTSHNPPLLITTGDVFDQRDALLAALKEAKAFIGRCVDWYGDDPPVEQINKAIEKAEGHA